ncbi:M48 family metallopeptidase [Pseudorhodoferax sp.]|uniref:M48 family metallopeptidase n=1 Tax=Pseudorhodoferax sp. TaxID=1993553 RepID=UPI002DD66845|nr:M48 family metallopeptidase [Pseudorhodoferax sp.]
MDGLSARYFDGRSARARPVLLRLQGGQLRIEGEDFVRELPAAAVQWPERTRHGLRVADLPHGGSLQCDDAAAWDAWRGAAGHRDSWTVRAQQSWRGVLACVVALVLLAWAFQQWGIPAVARGVAAAAPAHVDAALGQAVLRAVDESLMRPSRLPAATQDRVRGAFAAHLRASGEALPDWQLLFRDSRIGPNALALPGGMLVLTDQLVALVDEDPEVITAVLAHELGHVRHRHGLRMVVQVGLLGAAASLVLGDFSTVLAGAPVLLGQAHYSRAAEREADAEAERLLRAAGISPAVMLRLFERLAEQRRKQAADQAAAEPSWLGLAFATHPADAERIRFFEEAAQRR